MGRYPPDHDDVPAIVVRKNVKWGGDVGIPVAVSPAVVVELDPPRRVLETWRSKDFPEDAPDSILQVFFEANEQGTMFHVRQWCVHEGIIDAVDRSKRRARWRRFDATPRR